MPYIILSHRGPAKVQELIDSGALETWQEENGLEMVAEFTRSVSGETMQRKTIGVERERFLFTNVYVGFLSICWASLYSIRVLACRIQFFKLKRARSYDEV